MVVIDWSGEKSGSNEINAGRAAQEKNSYLINEEHKVRAWSKTASTVLNVCIF